MASEHADISGIVSHLLNYSTYSYCNHFKTTNVCSLKGVFKCLPFIAPHLSGVWFVEGCPQIATCGATHQGCTSARKQPPNLPLRSGRGSVQPCHRILQAADVGKPIVDILSLCFAALRCLTGLSTTASQGGQTEKAGNTQLIFQRVFL